MEALATPPYCQTHPRHHHPTTTSPRSREAQRQVRAQIKGSEDGIPCLSPSQHYSRAASIPVSRWNTYHHKSRRATLQSTLLTKTGQCQGFGTHQWMQGDIRLNIGWLAEEPKAEEEKHWGDLGRNKSGKREDWGDKRGQLCVSKRLVYICLVCTVCPVYWLNFISASFPEWSILCSMCNCVYTGLEPGHGHWVPWQQLKSAQVCKSTCEHQHTPNQSQLSDVAWKLGRLRCP